MREFDSSSGFVGAWLNELARMFDSFSDEDEASFETRFAASLIREKEVDPGVAAEMFDSAARLIELMAKACRVAGREN